MKLPNLFKSTLMAATLATSMAHAQDSADKANKSINLFNGNNLDGWVVRGGTANFAVEDGCIVGTTVEGSPNTFLCTEKDYYNFELRFKVKLDNSELNSGCQVRSHFAVKEGRKNGHVFGYQVEIASNGDAGFVYDEGGRGWLSKDRTDPSKRGAFKVGEWNDYRIRCVGSNVETWINGQAIATVNDDKSLGGLIGLQVHSVPGDPKWKVRWKDIELTQLPDTDFGLKPLLNDPELKAFETEGGWYLDEEEGFLGFKPKPAEYEGRYPWTIYENYLWLKQPYGEFVSRFEYKFNPGGNSGFYFHVQDKNDPPKTGPELQLEESASKKGEKNTWHDCGGLMMGAPIKRADKNVFKGPGVWNRMLVKYSDGRLKVWHNGLLIQNLDLDKHPVVAKHPRKGWVALQDHGMPVFFRNWGIAELNKP